MILPAPRVKNGLWKVTFWMMVLVISGQFAWLATIPMLRRTVQIETQYALQARVKKIAPSLPKIRPVDGVGGAILAPPPAMPEAEAPSSLVPQFSARLAVPQARDHSEEVGKLAKEAAEYRAMGDVALALEKLREADRLDPEQAPVLLPLAELYEQAGDLADAKQVWDRLAALGEKGGASALVARQKLSDLASREAAIHRENFEKTRATLPRRLTVRAVTQGEASDPGARAYTVAIATPPGAPKMPASDVRVQTYFFEADQENVMAISAVAARWLSEPVDWAGGAEETLSVTVGQILTPGTTFYGYLVRIFHKGELQDEIAEPPQLSAMFPPETAGPK